MNMELETAIENFPELAGDLQAFAAHVHNCRLQINEDSYNLDLKHDHSLRVLAVAGEMLKDLRPDRPLGRAILLAALYHDFGRFTQYLKYKTYRDSRSEDHGILGARTLARFKLPLESPPGLRALVLGAVALHNRITVPAELPAALNFAARVVRDADKLDIMALMRRHFTRPEGCDPVVVLHLPDEPDKFSGDILRQALNGGIIDYGDLRFVNDFKILFACWRHDLNFRISRDLLNKSGNLRSIINTLPTAARIPLLNQLSNS